MVVLDYVHLKQEYKYLWLRYINGVDLTQHCARTFIGRYDERFHGFLSDIRNVELQEARWYYLCGVDSHGQWARNLHLAFVASAGSEINLDNSLIECRIVNARQIHFDNSYIDWSLPQAKKKEFNTCRNWWFSNMIAREAGAERRTGSLFEDY